MGESKIKLRDMAWISDVDMGYGYWIRPEREGKFKKVHVEYTAWVI